MNTFISTNILIPNKEVDMEKWSVIACDQFTSQPDYWERIRENVGKNVSTLNLILPEAELSDSQEDKINNINDVMYEYLENGVFMEYPDSLIYVERTLQDGSIRCGIIGAIDLEKYDFTRGSCSEIRATEKTVIERIPPRVKIRENAPVELPHVIILCDDEKRELVESVTSMKDNLHKLYDFELMENGGHISGWVLDKHQKEMFLEKIESYKNYIKNKYRDINENIMYFAVGDGNHSLATAKTCYEQAKREGKASELSRYALVELENLHSEAQKFEPIHRILTSIDVDELLKFLETKYSAPDGYEVQWYSENRNGVIYLNKEFHQLPVGVLQLALDEFIDENDGVIDYIHGEDVLVGLSQKKNNIGFIVPTIEKDKLFKTVMLDGSLPRKTFSMGHASEKRYYLEAKKIK